MNHHILLLSLQIGIPAWIKTCLNKCDEREFVASLKHTNALLVVFGARNRISIIAVEAHRHVTRLINVICRNVG